MRDPYLRPTWLLVCGSFILVAGIALDAQWIKLPTPGLPRLPDGKPHLAAPAPRTADRRPDLSGLWKNDAGDRLYNNITADLQVSDVVQVPAGTLSRYVGTYDTDDDGTKHFVSVTLDGTSLWFDYDGKGKELLVALTPTRFSWSGSIVEFSSAADGGLDMALHYVESTERGSRRK